MKVRKGLSAKQRFRATSRGLRCFLILLFRVYTLTGSVENMFSAWECCWLQSRQFLFLSLPEPTFIWSSFSGSSWDSAWSVCLRKNDLLLHSLSTNITEKQRFGILWRFLSQGVMFPAMHCLWGKWAPPLERSKLMTKYLSGKKVISHSRQVLFPNCSCVSTQVTNGEKWAQGWVSRWRNVDTLYRPT